MKDMIFKYGPTTPFPPESKPKKKLQIPKKSKEIDNEEFLKEIEDFIELLQKIKKRLKKPRAK